MKLRRVLEVAEIKRTSDRVTIAGTERHHKESQNDLIHDQLALTSIAYSAK